MNRDYAFCRPWKIVLLLSKLGSASTILSLALSMLWEIPASSNVIYFFFCWHDFLRDIFVFPSQPRSCPSPGTCGCIHSLSESRSVTIHSQLLFYDCIYAWFKCTCSVIIFISLAYFYLCWATLSRLSIFVKCLRDLSLGNKKATQLHALLSVHKHNNRCTVTLLPIASEGRSVICHQSWCASVFL